MSSSVISTLFGVLASTLGIYSFLLIIRVLLSWFPNLDFSNPIISNLLAITDPYLNIFRGIIPAIGGIDISPILAFILLDFVKNQLFRAQYLFTTSSFQFLN